MAVERGYEQRTMPSAGAAQPLPTAENYGAGLGRAIGEFGDDQHRRDIRAYQLDRQQQAAEQSAKWSRDFAAYRTTADDAERQRQSGGLDGYAKDVAETYNKGWEKLSAGITEESVLNSARAQFDQVGAGVQSRAAAWEDAQRDAVSFTYFGQASKESAARIARDPSTFASEMALMADTIRQQAWTPEMKVRAAAATQQDLGMARGNTLANSNPEEFKLLLGTGEFDFLGADGMRILEGRADTEIRARAVAARQAQKEREDDLVDKINDLVGRQDRGEVIADADLNAASTVAAALGKPELANRVGEIADVQRVTRVYGPDNATPLQRQARIVELAAKGEKVTADELHELKILRDKTGGWDQAAAADPVGAQVRAGKASMLDLADTASVDARTKTWQRNVREGRGDKFFSGTELAQFKQEYAKGPRQRQAVLGNLDAIIDDQARDAAARQIAPNDVNFQHLAQVNAGERGMVIAGQEAKVANAALVKPDVNTSQGKAVYEERRKIENDIDLAFKAMPANYAAAAKTTAQEYYAGRLFSSGKQRIEEDWSADAYRDAVRVSLGGYFRNPQAGVGGIGYWQRREGGFSGGVGGGFNYSRSRPGHPFVISDGYTEKEWQGALATDLRRQVREGRGPVDVDGKTPFDLKNARPVMIRPGVYRWETDAGTVLNGKGERFISFVWGRK
jgi:hypothetical protein